MFIMNLCLHSKEIQLFAENSETSSIVLIEGNSLNVAHFNVIIMMFIDRKEIMIIYWIYDIRFSYLLV